MSPLETSTEILPTHGKQPLSLDPTRNTHMRRVFFLGAWVLAVVYALTAAPATTEYSIGNFREMVGTADIGGLQRLLNAPFLCVTSLVSLYPAFYAAVLLFEEDRRRRNTYWIFVLLSLFAGAFVLMPVIGLFGPVRAHGRPKGLVYRYLDSHGHGVFLSVLFVLTVLGANGSGWDVFLRQFRTDKVVNLVTFNLFLSIAGYSVLMVEDLRMRHYKPRPLALLLLRVPLINACAHLIVRPLLPDVASGTQPAALEARRP